jgi:hypothetical protein
MKNPINIKYNTRSTKTAFHTMEEETKLKRAEKISNRDKSSQRNGRHEKQSTLSKWMDICEESEISTDILEEKSVISRRNLRQRSRFHENNPFEMNKSQNTMQESIKAAHSNLCMYGKASDIFVDLTNFGVKYQNKSFKSENSSTMPIEVNKVKDQYTDLRNNLKSNQEIFESEITSDIDIKNEKDDIMKCFDMVSLKTKKKANLYLLTKEKKNTRKGNTKNKILNKAPKVGSEAFEENLNENKYTVFGMYNEKEIGIPIKWQIPINKRVSEKH